MSQKEGKPSGDLETPRKENKSPVKTRRSTKKKQDAEEEGINMALEYKLQECASNMNLSPIEVRKIIRKIVGNEHILALVKLQEEDDEKKKQEEHQETRSFNDSPTKLTRAKMRALNKVDPMLSFVQPLVESEQHEAEPELTALTKGQFHSDEEDEEYEPKEEDFMSDDDHNCTLSDLDSNPRTPMTPFSVDCSPVKCATTPDGVFKLPKQRTISNSEREEIVAKRTRSKVSLQLIPIESIEARFQPPDVTSDMYEQPEDPDKEWLEFLGDFQRPLDFSHLEEEDDDPVYVPLDNVPYDPDDLKDVNVPKKEIDDLLQELFGAWDWDSLTNEANNLEPILSPSKKSKLNVTENLNCSTDGSIIVKRDEQLHTPPLTSSIEYPMVEIPLMGAPNDFTRTSTLTTLTNEYLTKPLTVSTQNLPVVSSITQPPIIISEQSLKESKGVQVDPLEISTPNSRNVSKRVNRQSGPVRLYIFNDYVEKYKNLREAKHQEQDFGDIRSGFTAKQIKILEQQMRIYTQLTTQHFLQTFSHPKFWNKAEQHKRNLKELQTAVNNSSLKVCNLNNAVDLVERWEQDLSEINEENKKHIEFIEDEMSSRSRCLNRKKLIKNIMRFPPKVMQVILTEDVFLYPSFVPKMAFRTDERSNAIQDFAPSELMLLAMGLERYLIPIQESEQTNLSVHKSDLRAACDRISYNLTLGKTGRRIQNWIQMNKENEVYNPVQYFYEHNRAPPVQHEMLEYFSTYGMTLKDRVDELPPYWKDFSTALNTVEVAKYCGNKSISSFVGELSEISKSPSSQKGKKIYQEIESPNIIVNINYIFPGCTPEALIQSNILPATPSSSNFIFDWNQGKLRPETVSFNESRFSEISNDSICTSPFNISTSTIGTPIKEVLLKRDHKLTSTVKRKRTSASPSLKRKKEPESRKHVFAKFIVDYRWNYIHKILRVFKSSPILYYIAREFKALELYTDLLVDLKMNCKKSETAVQKRSKESEDESIPKSKKAARMEENFRHMLMPDSKEEANRKDELYALNYFEKVEETFKSANKVKEFEQFEEILRNFDISIHSVPSLYKKIETLFLPDYPELAEAFLAFLHPHQAAEVGKFYEHFIEANMRTFINKLNIYFNKQPAQIRKILNTLCELSDDPNVTMEKIKPKVLPLLKGNQFLTDWFLEMFPSEKVPESLITTPELVKLKEIDSENNDNYEIIPYSELISDTSENQVQSCQTRYVNGRIFYGSKILLPAKLTFIAEEHAKRLNLMAGEDSGNDQVRDCVHGVREYGENRLSKLMSGDSDSTSGCEETNNNLSVEQICDENELKMHAVRLNPTLYSTPTTGNSTIEPLSPKKQVSRSHERRKSPKKSVPRSPVCSKKAPDPVASTSSSPAISAARKMKVLINDKPSCSKELKQEVITPPIEVIPEPKFEPKCWTREEDKIILEEIRGNSNVDAKQLIVKISEKLTTRTCLEIEERHKFLLDVLSKLQKK